MAINDLAAGGVEHDPYVPEQLLAGEAKLVTGWAPTLQDVVKYEVVVLTPTGLSDVFDFDGAGDGDSEGAITLPTQGINCVITAQAATTGQNCPYFSSGFFNHALLTWPAALDTLAKRKAFFASTPIQIGALNN
jgi:hypothetical protein